MKVPADVLRPQSASYIAVLLIILTNVFLSRKKIILSMKSLMRLKKFPGGCTSKESCEAFCSDFANVKECMRFAKDAKISVKKGSDEITPENMEKFAELAEKGETPGGCKSESECRDYCEDATHFDECITFAEKAGLMPKDKVEKIKKLGGRGPGGCSSSKTCEAYC